MIVFGVLIHYPVYQSDYASMRPFIGLLLLPLLFFFVSGCTEQQPIQRGFKYLGETVKSHFEPVPSNNNEEVSLDKEAPDTPSTSLVDTSVIPSVDALRRDTAWYRFQQKPKPVLNLSLPDDWQWHDDALVSEHQTFPNVFKRLPFEGRFSVSGRLHIDESEEAATLPTIELLQGAEVEFMFRTR